MIQAELFEIRINEIDAEQLIILSEIGGERRLPIVIGMFEANSIQIHIQGFQPQRPLTHDLMSNIIKALGGKIERVVISDLRDGTFYAQIVVQTEDADCVIDARPSDAIALAVRSECPIFIEEHVLERNF